MNGSQYGAGNPSKLSHRWAAVRRSDRSAKALKCSHVHLRSEQCANANHIAVPRGGPAMGRRPLALIPPCRVAATAGVVVLSCCARKALTSRAFLRNTLPGDAPAVRTLTKKRRLSPPLVLSDITTGPMCRPCPPPYALQMVNQRLLNRGISGAIQRRRAGT